MLYKEKIEDTFCQYILVYEFISLGTTPEITMK